jgi:hypothetical protein
VPRQCVSTHSTRSPTRKVAASRSARSRRTPNNFGGSTIFCNSASRGRAAHATSSAKRSTSMPVRRASGCASTAPNTASPFRTSTRVSCRRPSAHLQVAGRCERQGHDLGRCQRAEGNARHRGRRRACSRKPRSTGRRRWSRRRRGRKNNHNENCSDLLSIDFFARVMIAALNWLREASLSNKLKQYEIGSLGTTQAEIT